LRSRKRSKIVEPGRRRRATHAVAPSFEPYEALQLRGRA
jgi:hypothetical protein